MNKCKHCGGDIAIRNPSGYCDHLYYPDNCEQCHQRPETEWEDAFREIYYSAWGNHPADKLALMLATIRGTIAAERRAARREGALEERQFILNVLDGIDEADRQIGLEPQLKSIRFALQSRIIPE